IILIWLLIIVGRTARLAITAKHKKPIEKSNIVALAVAILGAVMFFSAHGAILDLYLLHWPQGVTNLAGVVADFESLRAAGKSRAWGVSNFTVSDMEDLFRVPHGDRCATNQVLYNVGSRDIEHDLLPWCELRGMPVMAYTPLGGDSVRDPTLARIGATH